MTSSQNLRTVADPEHGEGPASEVRVGVASKLLSVLDMACGSRGAALEALARALAAAGLASLPEDAPGALEFARGHLLASLEGDIGAALAVALVEDFEGRLGGARSSAVPSTTPPSSKPRPVARVSLRARSAPPSEPDRRVLLLDGDRVLRASLARAVMRARLGVDVVESADELQGALCGARPDAVIIDPSHPAAGPILKMLVAAAPDVPVVVRGAGAGAAQLLVAAGATRSELCPRDASPEDLLDAVRRAFGP